MQLQITAEREKRAVIATSEGQKQKEINIAEGERAAMIAQSEGEKQAAINKAEGEARAIEAVAKAQAEAIRAVAQAISQPQGMQPSICKSRKSTWKLSEKLLRKVIAASSGQSRRHGLDGRFSDDDHPRAKTVSRPPP